MRGLRNLLAACAMALGMPGGVKAQVCVPELRGFTTGPVHIDFNSTETSMVVALMESDVEGAPALYAAGRFLLPPARPTLPSYGDLVLRYKDGQWSTMREGLPVSLPSTPGTGSGSGAMRDLAVQDFSAAGGPGRSLYAVGDNAQVYRWGGAAWESIGPTSGGAGYTLLATTDAQGPVLLAGGSAYPGGVIAWRGAGTWSPYAPLSPTGAVYRLRAVDDGTGPAVWALGSFRDASRGITGAAKLVNGQWTPMAPAAGNSAISDVTLFDDGSGHGAELYVTGVNLSTPAMSNVGVARLRGGVWSPIANSRVTVATNTTGPTFFKVDEGAGERLHVGGFIQDFNVSSGLVRLGPSGWEAPVFLSWPPGAAGTAPGAAFAMVRFDDGSGAQTYIGGSFQMVGGSFISATLMQTALSHIRSVPGGFESTAEGLGETVTSETSSRFRYDLNVVNYGGVQRLIAMGGFARAGGRAAVFGALFDGHGFTPLSVTGSATSGRGLQSSAVFTFNGQERIVSSTSISPLGMICTWDGTTWTRLGVQPGGGLCYALWVKNGRLFALTDAGLWRYDTAFWSNVGSFTNAQAVMVGDAGAGERLFFVTVSNQGPGIYQFDGQTLSLWAGTNSTSISALCLHDDGAGLKMYILGLGVPGGIQRRAGNIWEPLSAQGLSLNGTAVYSLASFDDGAGPGLYAAGPISNAGGQACTGVARWRNGVWSNIAPVVPQQSLSGIQRSSMAVFQGRLYIAGEFTSIGGVNADHLAYIEACPYTCDADFNHDGDFGTDQDIEAFFRCLAGDCCVRCTADFNNDGDFGTDQDIESFFRVLAGGAC
jgi:hypothetical protein